MQEKPDNISVHSMKKVQEASYDEIKLSMIIKVERKIYPHLLLGKTQSLKLTSSFVKTTNLFNLKSITVFVFIPGNDYN